MRFGYFVSHARRDADESVSQVIKDVIEQIECAEAAGFDIVWFPERHFNAGASMPYPLFSIIDAAVRTRRIRLGSSVIIAPFRHPLLLAEEIGMVDQMTGGRLEVGLARGASPYQYQRFGINDTEAAGRLNECMEILLGIWGRDSEFAYDGQYYSFPETYVSPRPVQAPHPPLSLAARSPESLRYCLENGLAIHTTPLRQPKSAALTTMQTIAAVAGEFEVQPKIDVAIEIETFISDSEEAIVDAMRCLERSHIQTQNFGRNGKQPERGFGRLDALPPGLEIRAETLRERTVTGDPASVLAQVREFQQMGMTEFIAYMDFGQSQRDILRSIELFGKQVIAQDWSKRPVNLLDACSRPGHRERRAELEARGDKAYGTGWRQWREAEWIGHFEAKAASAPDAALHEIFDIAVNPTNIRAEATGIVPPSGKLCVARDLKCPVCKRPAVALSYRGDGESPAALRESASMLAIWDGWHDLHP